MYTNNSDHLLYLPPSITPGAAFAVFQVTLALPLLSCIVRLLRLSSDQSITLRLVPFRLNLSS